MTASSHCGTWKREAPANHTPSRCAGTVCPGTCAMSVA